MSLNKNQYLSGDSHSHAEYNTWSHDARFAYDERIAILCEAGPVTPEADAIARSEARKVQAAANMELGF